MRHITDNTIEHGSGLGIDPSGDGPIGSMEKFIDGNHGGIKCGTISVLVGRSDVGKSVFNNDINSQSERFYAKADGAFLSEGVRE